MSGMLKRQQAVIALILVLTGPIAADDWQYAQNMHKRVRFENDGVVVRCELIFPDNAWKEARARDELQRACTLVAEEVVYLNRERLGKIIDTEVGQVFLDDETDQLMLVIKIKTRGAKKAP